MSSGHDAHDIKKEVRTYLVIGATLWVLTLVTVLASRVHLGLAGNITLALVIATVKATLVCLFFMHLISEKQYIYTVLIITVIFLIPMPILFLGAHHDPITGTEPVVAETVSHPVH